MKKSNSNTKSELNLLKLAQILKDEDSARKFLESLMWGDGEPVCPKCGNIGAYRLKAKKETKKPMRDGVCKCKACRRQFTVTVGTIFERSHIPLTKWLMTYYLFVSSKKGISAHQVHRQLDISYETAWFMVHRIRYGFTSTNSKPLKGTVEVDETYVGGKPRYKGQSKRGRGTKKTPVVALVQRNGKVKTRVVADITGDNLKSIIRENVHPKSTIMTDGLPSYNGIGEDFEGGHEVVDHNAKEYVRGEAYTNTVESFFGLFKRALNGTWHHVSKEHLHRYATEMEFRWNSRKQNDGERMNYAISLVGGKRLMYSDAIKKAA